MHEKGLDSKGIFRSFFGLGVFLVAFQGAQILAISQTVEPANGVVGVAINPTLEISCHDPAVMAAQYEIATDSDFANVVYESLETVNDLCSHIALAQ